MARIYVASSWRNPFYSDVVTRLIGSGHEVYDFRNPPHGGKGFRWTDIDENAVNWSFSDYKQGLGHPLAERQFGADLEALNGKRVVVFIPEMQEPGLMYKLFDGVTGTLEELLQQLA